LARARVLIVDEPEERLPFYRSVLGEFDVETILADCRAADLDLVLQDDYALILVNLAAPRAEGLGTVRRIRANPRTRHTPVVLIGIAGSDPALAGIGGPIDCIPAPVLSEVLRTKVRIFVELQQRVTEHTAQLQAAHSSEQRLRREAEQLCRLKDELLSTLSHELRTPLNAIFGWITLLRTGRLDAATAERALETIERNARAQKNLIDNLQDVSRIVSGKVQLELTQFDPRQVVESALATVGPAAEARRITLTPQLTVSAAPLRADFARLQEALANMLSNAIKFTPIGGRVWIRMERDPGTLQITVTDTGQGIAAEMLPQIFDRFRQADGASGPRRAGLGLAVVRRLVELHGGTATASSPGEGRGATFTIRIPVLETQDEPVAVLVPPPRLPAADRLRQIAGLAVLVVDDDPGSREVVASMLQGYGARVTTVDSGERALSLLMQQPPDVLIADLAMPQMTGIDLIQRIRTLRSEQGGQVPAIAVSAFAAEPDRLLALQAGFDSHVGKPVAPEELALVLVDTLQHR
jgi:signal transduction histidine kinase/ActR/RegA family two-component response regulator